MSRGTYPLPPVESLTDLEEQLAGTLRPVQTPRGLATRLRERVRLAEPRRIAERISNWRFFFVVFSSVISGMLITITVARAMFHLFGRRSL